LRVIVDVFGEVAGVGELEDGCAAADGFFVCFYFAADLFKTGAIGQPGEFFVCFHVLFGDACLGVFG